MEQVVFPAGHTVFSEGDPSTHTYLILAGSVDIVVTGRDGRPVRVNSLGPQEVFGEMGIIDPAPRSATVITREETACTVYTSDEVIEMMSTDPAEALVLIKSMILRLRNSNRKVVSKTAPSPPRRPEGVLPE